MATLIGVIIFIIIIGILFVYDTFLWGVILYKFWNWFVLPVFTTLPVLTLVQAIGLMFVINLFKSHFMGENIRDEFKKNKWESPVAILILPWITLIFGWLAWQIWLQ